MIPEHLGKSSIAWAAAGAALAIPSLSYALTEEQGLGIVVNATISGNQLAPAVAMDAQGDFAVTWYSSGSGLYVQRYNASGLRQGGPVRIDAAHPATADAPTSSVAMDAQGDFVVAWLSDRDVYARRFDAGNQTFGSIIKTGIESASKAAVAMDAGGDFVVAAAAYQDRPMIVAQRYDTMATAQGSPLLVDAGIGGELRAAPAVAMDAEGDFVVAYEGTYYRSYYDTYFVRRYDKLGIAQGDAIAANSSKVSLGSPVDSVAMDAGGDFLVTWKGARAARFNADGSRQGGEILEDISGQVEPAGSVAAAMGAGGSFAVAWEKHTGNNHVDVFVQQYDSMGDPIGASVPVNAATQGIRSNQAMAMDANGDWVVAWQGNDNAKDGSPTVVYLRRFAGAENVDLALTQTQSVQPEPGYALIGGSVTYAFSLTNQHSVSTLTGVAAIDHAIGSASNLRISDLIPPAATYSTSSGIDWSCDIAALPKLVCRYAGVLAANDSAPDLYVTLNMPSNTNEALRNIGVASGHQTDSNPVNNRAIADTVVCSSGAKDTFEIEDAVAYESEGSARITVVRSGGACTTASVDFETADDTAVAGSDYMEAAGTLHWGIAEQGAKVFSVPILDDSSIEPNETVALNLSNGGDATLVTPAKLTILDDDTPATVGLTSGDQTIEEGGNPATITATLSAPVGRPVKVPLKFKGTAGIDHDYTVSGKVISISPGHTSGSVTLTALSDGLDEPNEWVEVSMGTPVNAAAAGVVANNVTIVDEDQQPGIRLSASAVSMPERNGQVLITGTLTAASSYDVSVALRLGGTAAAGTDYAISSRKLIIPAGQTSASITLTAVDDALNEGDETIFVEMGKVVGAVRQKPLGVSITIIDDDPPPTVSITGTNQSISENGGTATITAALSAPSGLPVFVPVVSSGTATAGMDYALSSGRFEFPAGTTKANITVTAINDAVDEPNEKVVLQLGTPTNATVAGDASRTITILDDDPRPNVSFTVGDSSVREGTAAATKAVSVSLSRASGRPVTVTISRTGGDAREGRDFVLIDGGTITIPAGQQSAASVQVLDDNLKESDETATFSLSAPVNAILGVITTHTLTISDND